MPHHIPKQNAIHVPQRHPGLNQSASPFLPGVPISPYRSPHPIRLETSPVLLPLSPHSSSHGPNHKQVTKSALNAPWQAQADRPACVACSANSGGLRLAAVAPRCSSVDGLPGRDTPMPSTAALASGSRSVALGMPPEGSNQRISISVRTLRTELASWLHQPL